jgi:hydroxyacylglutathione hydrolase
MKMLTENVYSLESATGANGYVVTLTQGFAVLDPGLPFSSRKVVEELRAEGALGDVRHIFLTHYDMDHAGAARRLSDESGAMTWIGAADAAVLNRDASPGTTTRSLMTMVGRPKLPQACTLLTERTEPVAGVTAIPTPGHTPGHFAFEVSGATFIGDAAIVAADGTFKDFPGLLITDKAAARQSIELLRSGTTEWVFPGHGKPFRRSGNEAAGAEH